MKRTTLVIIAQLIVGSVMIAYGIFQYITQQEFLFAIGLGIGFIFALVMLSTYLDAQETDILDKTLQQEQTLEVMKQ